MSYWLLDMDAGERSIEVDGITSSEPLFAVNQRGGAVQYWSDPKTGEVVSFFSGRAAAEAIMSPLLKELNLDMNPSPENTKIIGTG